MLLSSTLFPSPPVCRCTGVAGGRGVGKRAGGAAVTPPCAVCIVGLRAKTRDQPLFVFTKIMCAHKVLEWLIGIGDKKPWGRRVGDVVHAHVPEIEVGIV